MGGKARRLAPTGHITRARQEEKIQSGVFTREGMRRKGSRLGAQAKKGRGLSHVRAMREGEKREQPGELALVACRKEGMREAGRASRGRERPASKEKQAWGPW